MVTGGSIGIFKEAEGVCVTKYSCEGSRVLEEDCPSGHDTTNRTLASGRFEVVRVDYAVN